MVGKGGKGSTPDHDLRLKRRPDMAVIAIELLYPRKRGGDPLDRITRKVEIKRMFQGRVPLMRGKDLNIAPGETAEVRLELSSGIANRADPLGIGKEGEVENALPHIRLASMNKISEIGHTDGIDLLAREENIQNRVYNGYFVRRTG